MKYTSAQLESLMVKARLLGKDIESIPTKCGHVVYFFKEIVDGLSILHIPDDVEYITESKKEYNDIDCKTLIVIGGRNLKNTTCMFTRCHAQSLDFSNFDTSKVTDMSQMFKECKVQSLDLSSFDTSQVTNMQSMFDYCEAQSLDLSSFNTSQVIDMSKMFCSCKTQSLDLSSFDTSKVTDMTAMFRGCKAQSLDLSSFNVSHVTKFLFTFMWCEAEVKATDDRLVAEVHRAGLDVVQLKRKSTDHQILAALNER